MGVQVEKAAYEQAEQMEVEDNMADETATPSQPIIISDGAALALGIALSRFITVSNAKRPRPSVDAPLSEPAKTKSKGKGKRATQPVVLVENEEVKKELLEREENKKKYKLQKQRKIKFETNARVIPDVTTNYQTEKILMETATNGAVLFFNTVSKTQKANRELLKKKKKGNKKVDKDKKVITKQSFMDLMKVGIQKSTAKALPMNIDLKKQPDDDKNDKENKENENKESDDDNDDEDEEADDEDGEDEDESDDDDSDDGSDGKDDFVSGNSTAAPKWLKDDFLTSGSAKLKAGNWDEKSTDHADDSSEEESEEEDMDMDEREEEEEDSDDEMEDDSEESD